MNLYLLGAVIFLISHAVLADPEPDLVIQKYIQKEVQKQIKEAQLGEYINDQVERKVREEMNKRVNMKLSETGKNHISLNLELSHHMPKKYL